MRITYQSWDAERSPYPGITANPRTVSVQGSVQLALTNGKTLAWEWIQARHRKLHNTIPCQKSKLSRKAKEAKLGASEQYKQPEKLDKYHTNGRETMIIS